MTRTADIRVGQSGEKPEPFEARFGPGDHGEIERVIPLSAMIGGGGGTLLPGLLPNCLGLAGTKRDD